MRRRAQGLLAPRLTYGTVPAVVFVMFCQKMFRQSALLALMCCGLLLPFASAVSADGRYERTKDGKTMVWNDDPAPGDVASWSGDRDAEGYADGFGTLTWYTGGTRETLYAYYFGNMVRGKFNGPVNGHSKGVTNHAVFSNGKRTTRWASGPTRSWSVPRGKPEPVRTPAPVVFAKAELEKPTEFNPAQTVVRASPSPVSVRTTNATRPVPDFNGLLEQPAPSPTEDVPAEGPKPNPVEAATPPAAQTSDAPKVENLQAIQALVGPPPSLRTAPSPDSTAEQSLPGSSSVPESHLKKEEVVALADAEARKRGYELNDYERPDPVFDPTDQTWSLSYDLKSTDDGASNKHLAIAIDDETKKTAVVPSR